MESGYLIPKVTCEVPAAVGVLAPLMRCVLADNHLLLRQSSLPSSSRGVLERQCLFVRFILVTYRHLGIYRCARLRQINIHKRWCDPNKVRKDLQTLFTPSVLSTWHRKGNRWMLNTRCWIHKDAAAGTGFSEWIQWRAQGGAMQSPSSVITV